MSDRTPIYVSRWQWLEVLASDCGPPGATTRHVLHAIAVHMNSKGESAFPSTRKIANRTALSERAVTKHVSLARLSGWIEVTKRRRPGGDWDSNQYRAMVPGHAIVNVPPIKRRMERNSVGTEPNNDIYRTLRREVRNKMPTNYPINNPSNVNNAACELTGDCKNRTFEQDFPRPEARSVTDTLMLAALKKANRRQ